MQWLNGLKRSDDSLLKLTVNWLTFFNFSFVAYTYQFHFDLLLCQIINFKLRKSLLNRSVLTSSFENTSEINT